MANDVANKTTSSNEISDNTPSSNGDSQKVPPLRIVLNTAANQRVPTTASTPNTSQQQASKRDKSQDVKSDGPLKTGGRVRIRLAANKSGGVSNSETPSSGGTNKSSDSVQKGKSSDKIEESNKEDSIVNHQSHLRRITRRSHRTVQSVVNEDDESISSMTSIDENQSSNTNNNSDSNATNDTEQLNAGTSNSTTATSTSKTDAPNGSTNAETPRRYKRRKGETCETLGIDNDSSFCFQNYKLPIQNSIELFKNIRKQVDKRLKSLNSIHPKTPYGFRDYMLTQGAYLLDGNKLGNGTNLLMSEDGGLQSAPLGKYRALRHSRINYSVPNRAKVPLGLPVNSPLYNLFIEQEKERHHLRMQHIKEREKLTLATEQEIMRVYTQAALTAADQEEPFSACTMLKHQEIYNYLDSDGMMILSRQDSQQDQAKPADGVRTRRRQHGPISPPPTSRKTSNTDENNSNETSKKDQSKAIPGPVTENTSNEVGVEASTEKTATDQLNEGDETSTAATEDEKNKARSKAVVDAIESVTEAITKDGEKSSLSHADHDKHTSKQSEDASPKGDKDKAETVGDQPESAKTEQTRDDEVELSSTNNSSDSTGATKPEESIDKIKLEPTSSSKDEVPKNEITGAPFKDIESQSACSKDLTNCEQTITEDSVSDDQVMESQSSSKSDAQQSLSEEEKRAYDKDLFLSQLQMIDDKWEDIRRNMLIRHRNEAESLHAIQKLEWEWKTKEIGACDIRTTPVIDTTLVPKLNIYSQDY